jgi:hypothetical protein
MTGVRPIANNSGAMPQLLVQITEEQAAWLDARCDRFNPKSRLIRDLIDSARSALDTPVTLTERATADPRTSGDAIASGVSKAVLLEVNESIKKQPLEKKAKSQKPKDAFSARVVSPDLVPPDLLDCQQLLPEWWTVKKGVRSEGVWNRVCGKLRGWTPELRREALERAIASGWGDVFEPKPVTARQAKVAVDEGAARLERFREKGWI